MALRGAALSHFYKLPRGCRNPPGWGEQEATRERGQHGTRSVASGFGHERFSRGVNSNDKDLLWLLAPAKFDK